MLQVIQIMPIERLIDSKIETKNQRSLRHALKGSQRDSARLSTDGQNHPAFTP